MISMIRHRTRYQGPRFLQISIPANDACLIHMPLECQNVHELRWRDHASIPFPILFRFPHWKVNVPSMNGLTPILILYSPFHRRLMSPSPTFRRSGKLSYSTTTVYLKIYRRLLPLVSPCLPSGVLFPTFDTLLAIQGARASSTDLIALEYLLQSLESGGFVASPEIIHPPTMA